MSNMKEEFAKKFSKRLKELRKENNLSQADVAKVLNVSRETYNRYENMNRVMSPEDISILADFYKISTDYILAKID